MGAMYAAHFVDAGFGVRFVARGERARRLEASGLRVNGRPLTVEVVDADASDPWPADLVIFAVKDQQLAEAIDEASGVVGAETIILSILNGLDSEERIAERYGDDRVLLCVAMAMDAQRDGGDIIFRQAGRLVFGRPRNDEVAEDVAAVQRALTRAGLAWETPSDMRRMMWWKFMVNVGINQASAVLQLPYGAFQHEGDARSLMMALMGEVIAVADAEGVALGPEDVERWSQVLAGQPPQGWTSMHQDVAAGRPTEVETFAGRVVELGRRHGVPTPYNQAMLWILRRG